MVRRFGPRGGGARCDSRRGDKGQYFCRRTESGASESHPGHRPPESPPIIVASFLSRPASKSVGTRLVEMPDPAPAVPVLPQPLVQHPPLSLFPSCGWQKRKHAGWCVCTRARKRAHTHQAGPTPPSLPPLIQVTPRPPSGSATPAGPIAVLDLPPSPATAATPFAPMGSVWAQRTGALRRPIAAGQVRRVENRRQNPRIILTCL